MDIKGQVAVVTGANRGGGQKIADALEERGMVVASVARSAARFTADVSDPADVAGLKAAVTLPSAILKEDRSIDFSTSSSASFSLSPRLLL